MIVRRHRSVPFFGQDGFRRVDFDYIVNVARLGKEQGCEHFHLVSSQGADENSFFLYPKVKVR